MTLPARVANDRPLTIGRWDPFREIEDAWSRMGALLGDVFGGERRPGTFFSSFGLPVDIEETDDQFVVEIDLPGVRREDMSIDLRENELYITGEIKPRERTGKMRRQSRPVGRFEHQITLPGEVNPDSVEATLHSGVLTVKLAKAKRATARHIEVSET